MNQSSANNSGLACAAGWWHIERTIDDGVSPDTFPGKASSHARVGVPGVNAPNAHAHPPPPPPRACHMGATAGMHRSRVPCAPACLEALSTQDPRQGMRLGAGACRTVWWGGTGVAHTRAHRTRTHTRAHRTLARWTVLSAAEPGWRVRLQAAPNGLRRGGCAAARERARRGPATMQGARRATSPLKHAGATKHCCTHLTAYQPTTYALEIADTSSTHRPARP